MEIVDQYNRKIKQNCDININIVNNKENNENLIEIDLKLPVITIEPDLMFCFNEILTYSKK